MAKIALLPDLVADQIAAGEVIENVASAVKELVENALDAKASEITIRIEGGGLQRIYIEDNGCGMDREDALLCVKRHATSKIRSVDDLEQLSTMGFRGEALAAIASISKLEISTSNGCEACSVMFEGGNVSKITTIARNQGTTIEIKSLFFNTPARLKFQKSPAANAAAVLKIVQTLALCHPHVQFTLFSNDKITLQCYPASWKERVEELFGAFAHEVIDPILYGLIGKPEEGKANRSAQTLFINQRPIFSPLIAKAVKEGYGTRLKETLFPSFVLFLEVPADSIDVNVHPQKKEVRFRNESEIFQIVQNAICRTFEKHYPLPPPLPWEEPCIPPLPTFFSPPAAKWELPQPASFRLEEQFVPLPLEKIDMPLAILGDCLLTQKDLEWQFIDLRGAEARILFEEIEKGTELAQPLLWPIEYTTNDPHELVTLLKQANIEARVIGKQTIAIDSAPQNLASSDIIPFVQNFNNSAKEERRLAAAVTKTSRLIKRSYTLKEGELIWNKLCKCKDPLYDPLGKKIVSPLTKEHLTRLFS